MNSSKVKVTFLNNEGGTGFAQAVELDEGTTVSQFLDEQGLSPERFQIRVRTTGEGGQKQTLTPTGDYALKGGDFVTAVPQKVGGAS